MWTSFRVVLEIRDAAQKSKEHLFRALNSEPTSDFLLLILRGGRGLR